MLIAHFDDNALLWDKLLKDISNKQKTKKAISGMINSDRPTRFPPARYIHFLTFFFLFFFFFYKQYLLHGYISEKTFLLYDVRGSSLYISYKVPDFRFLIFFFFSYAPMDDISLEKARFSCLFFMLLDALFLSSKITSGRVF